MTSKWGTLSARQPLLEPRLTPEDMNYNNAPQILAITGSFFTAAALVVILRCYVRIKMLKVFGVDDYVMLVAMVSGHCYSIMRKFSDNFFCYIGIVHCHFCLLQTSNRPRSRHAYGGTRSRSVQICKAPQGSLCAIACCHGWHFGRQGFDCFLSFTPFGPEDIRSDPLREYNLHCDNDYCLRWDTHFSMSTG